VLGLLLTLSSNLVAIFIYWVVSSFSFFGWFLLFIRRLSSVWLPFPP
jgi:ABC-type microcin C transport system permease subunit YejE